METSAYIAIGSNVGECELNLLRALAEIGKIDGLRITAVSKFYKTSPVGKTDQPDFYNAAIRISTNFTPLQLLNSLKNIESSVFRREKAEKWGPRSMDLDILMFGDLQIYSEELEVPHPRMHERKFVLKPLSDIAPEALHPVSKVSVLEMLAQLDSDERVEEI